MEYNLKSMGYKMARIDEDELECLRKLEDYQHTNTCTSHTKMVNSKFVSNYQVVKLDEDELECLRKLGENTTTHQKAKSHKVATNNISCNNNNNNNNKADQVFENYANKRECQVSIYEKLESKKSEDINESAEKFIQSFKKQLLLQRLESIENVDKMLARGL